MGRPERPADVLAFPLDEKTHWPAELREEYRFAVLGVKGQLTPEHVAEVQADIAALAQFKTWLGTGRVFAKFTSPDDLAAKVEGALRQWTANHPERVPAVASGDERPVDRPEDYLLALYQRTCSIDIRGLKVGSGRATRFPIDELYIPLTTLGRKDEVRRAKDERERTAGGEAEMAAWGEAGGRIELDAALQNRRLAIIGDPGAGKSTFLRRIAFLLCRPRLGQEPPDAAAPLGLDDRPFPLLITVAALAEHVRNCLGRNGAPPTAESPAWLAHYVAHSCGELGLALSEPFLRSQLDSGAAMVLVDGLDEAPSERDRRRVAKIVEGAAEAYGRCRFVLTSRPGAYSGDVALPGFPAVRIEPLEDDAIEHFLDRWCRALFPEDAATPPTGTGTDRPDRGSENGTGTDRPDRSQSRFPSQAAAHRDELLDALHSRPEIRRLARNPVMLTALAVVHWHEKRLPEQRAELYESILDWLAKSRENRPDRPSAERCIALLQKLALAMQDHADGRQVQVARHWAARQIAEDFREAPEAERVERARQFLVQEELDSGIVVGRGDDLKFWHLTFQEYLAARAIGARPGDVRHEPLFRQEKLHAPEWRETVLLLAGVLYHQGIDRADAMFAGVLDGLGKQPTLEQQARTVGLLGAAVADLTPVKYEPRDKRYAQTLHAVMGIFQPGSPVPIDQAIAAAEALGQAGDPRLAKHHRAKNWVTIPAGEFWMGAQKTRKPNCDPEARENEAPVHKVHLSEYCIGRYPVTVVEYVEFIGHDGYKEEKYWQAGGFGQFTEPEQWEEQQRYPNRPVVGVSWFEASAYAAWAKCRLPTEAEWERAARGGDDRKYPWGNQDPDPTRMNYGTKTRDGWKPNECHPTPVGIYPQGVSVEGIADMAGNVWEWCADTYAKYTTKGAPVPEGPPEKVGRVVRGGSWGVDPGVCRVSCRYGFHPSDRDQDFGFRLVCVLFGQE